MDPIVAKQLNWARQEALALVSKAEEEVVEILAKAKIEGESIKKQAYKEGKQSGYEAGYEEGLNKGQAIIDDLSRQKKAVIEEVKAIQRSVYQENEQAMISLAYTIAEQVIKKQVELDPALTSEIVKNVLQEAQAGESYFIFVNPEDVEKVVESKRQFVPLLPPGAILRVLADPEITRGGCRLETNLGFTDGTIESQLAEVKKALNIL